MISAFGVEHGEIAKKHKLAYAIDDKLEGTKISNAARVRESRRGYKHGLSPDPKYKPPKYSPPGTWPRTEYDSSREQGMEHYDRLKFSKKHTDAERRDHYGRMSATMGATGALTGAVGAGARVMAHLEDKGHDPMGFTVRRRGKYTNPHYSPEMKSEILAMNATAHRGQAKILGATALMAGGLAAGYHYKKKKLQRQMVAKRRSKADVAGEVGLGAGTAGLGFLTLKNGMTAHHFMGDDANEAIKNGIAGHQIIADAKHGAKVTPKQLEHAKAVRRLGARVGPIKQLGAKGAAAAAVTSGAGLYELGRYTAHRHKKGER